ncbi:MAG: hypothetical protein AB4290_19550 [Spirulina sp.]
MMKEYKQYNLFFVGFLGAQILAIVFFNLSVDPYNVLKSPHIKGFNQAKPEQDTQVRLFKAIEITRLKPKTVLLGTSRTDVGLDVTHPRLEQLTPVYNLGILGANMYETKRYLEHAIANQSDLRRVILGIDFFAFNHNRSDKADFRENRLEIEGISWQDWLDLAFSLDTVMSSWETIVINRKHPHNRPYLDRGMRNEDNFLEFVLQKKPIAKAFQFSLKKFLKDPQMYGNYQLSQKYLKDFAEIVAICQHNHIDLYVFISPSHATQWEAIHAANLWSVFEDWKREIVKISPVWDFSGYHAIATEPIGNAMEYYLDSSHYRKVAGNFVFDRIFQHNLDRIPRGFGEWIDPDNIEDHLQRIRRDRQTWLQTHPKDLEILRKARSE